MKNSSIEWTDHTFNPWIGCQKVSPACKHCYAETQVNRFGGDFSKVRRITTDAYWKQPLKWNREAEKSGTRPRVFCASLADVFEDWKGPIHDHNGNRLANDFNGAFRPIQRLDVSLTSMNDVRKRLFSLIDQTPYLDWLLLTKRPENIERFWFDPDSLSGFPRRSNVWLGTTVENQEQANKRIPALLKCRDLSPAIFLSCEPLLGPVDLRSALWLEDQYCGLRTDTYPHKKRPIDWVIVGGESGHEARPMHPDWARDLRDQCHAAGVAFHFKQWGEWAPCSEVDPEDMCEARIDQSGRDVTDSPGLHSDKDEFMDRVGKKAAGRLLDGREWNEVPK